MGDGEFREEQWEHRYDEHVAPINRLVDDLLSEPGRGWAPYVAPMHGGVDARLLSILSDPGPMTQSKYGSGFLCWENDDPTAERICQLSADAGIDAIDVIPWNAYPWYINRAPKAAELEAGVEPLKRLIDLLSQLRVVMLHGGSAKDGWKRLIRKHPDIVAERRLCILPTYHPGRQAFRDRDRAVRESRREHLRESFYQAARYLA
jgi:hypothetical protein